jgi:hypothetical protein
LFANLQTKEEKNITVKLKCFFFPQKKYIFFFSECTRCLQQRRNKLFTKKECQKSAHALRVQLIAAAASVLVACSWYWSACWQP